MQVEFLVSLAVLCVTVFLTETHAHGCEYINGVNYENNETFMATNLFTCAIIRCVNGVVTTIYRGCKVDQSCFPLNNTFIDRVCRRYTCKRTSPFSGVYYPVHDRTYCVTDDRSCTAPENDTIINRIVDGQLQLNCRCTIVDGKEDYQCDPPSPLE
ncbi:hypothetical protein BsWGS_03444 [Bradybaena similaris]